ncbi:unnamed protein product [Boreogadus saida]
MIHAETTTGSERRPPTALSGFVVMPSELKEGTVIEVELGEGVKEVVMEEVGVKEVVMEEEVGMEDWVEVKDGGRGGDEDDGGAGRDGGVSELRDAHRETSGKRQNRRSNPEPPGLGNSLTAGASAVTLFGWMRVERSLRPAA